MYVAWILNWWESLEGNNLVRAIAKNDLFNHALEGIFSKD